MRLCRMGLLGALLAAALACSPAFAEGSMTLHEAADAGDVASIEGLLAAGTPVDGRDAARRTPLQVATRANHVEAARLLIAAGADVNAKDNIRDTPFLYAGAEGRDAILRLILDTGRAKLADTNRYGGTALIPAAHHGHPGTVAILLEAGLDVDHVNNLGWTALLEAVILGDGGPVYQEIVRLLLAAGADPHIADRDGVTPLAHARRLGFSALEDLLARAER